MASLASSSIRVMTPVAAALTGLTSLLTHTNPFVPRIQCTPPPTEYICALLLTTNMGGIDRNTPFRSFPYFSDLVCNEAAPSENSCCTSATRRSPSVKNVRIWSSSSVVRRRRIPPGRFMDARCRIASCLEEISTFHLFGPTSVILPMTRSPICGSYLIEEDSKRGITETSRA
jgi:hypothetical protein